VWGRLLYDASTPDRLFASLLEERLSTGRVLPTIVSRKNLPFSLPSIRYPPPSAKALQKC
jgi:hypothetical protein